ncbi:hypothetical protein F7018_16175 [Tenacibaculum aiptasiae]|uniref:Uncharacterized protein n=1 Tax=Tenacibaculum aiptasiae TaxID=426481 RepID=A0A7J5A7W3_9FLAO|nr:hypothetical protein [Tenacibaculum aiptasiae]KAB1153605.1 hypothetical protein F7018_16175 [Tenacibaculum aiptasiae]
MKKFKCRPFINQDEKDFYTNKFELQLAEPAVKQSYFQKVNNERVFIIRACIPNPNFKVYQIFSINKEVWIMISDRTPHTARNAGKNMILDIIFKESELPALDNVRLPSDLEKITINIYNDNRFSTKWKSRWKSMFFSPPAPAQKEGGIIIEGP